VLTTGRWQRQERRLFILFPELKELWVKTAGAQKRFEP
jgi:hypothetical protein